MKKQWKLVICALLAGSMVLTGCGASVNAGADAENAQEQAPGENLIESEDDSLKLADVTLHGAVTSVEGSVITMKVSGDRGMGGREMSGEGKPEGGQPPEMPEGEQPPEMAEGKSDNGQQPPEMAEGKSENGQQPPEMPEGEQPSEMAEEQRPPEMPEGKQVKGAGSKVMITIGDDSVFADGLTLAAIAEGDILTVELDEDGRIVSVAKGSDMGMPGSFGENGGTGGAEAIDYTALHEYTEDADVSGESFLSEEADENAVLVTDGADVTLTDMKIIRDSDDSSGGDSASFYGIGAAVLATDGTVTVADSEITTDADGGAGVFAYGNGTAVVSDTKIATSGGASGGIHVAGGGTLTAKNLTVTTEGQSSAAIRSDRGGGTMEVTGGSYRSSGKGSPAVYCTADITVNDAELEATGSEAVCIEGRNSLTLTNCDLTGNMPDDDQNDCTWNVIVYQSMSGDSEEGNGTFSMTGGTLTAKNGGMFYTTNTESTIELTDVEINYADDSEFLLRCTGNNNARGWGRAGSNGADCVFTANEQELKGNVIYDSISTLEMTLENGSIWTGTFVDDESCAGSGGDGTVSLTVDRDSSWIVTEDCSLTSLTCKGTVVDENGEKVTIKGADGTVYVKGGSVTVITVEEYKR